MAGLVNPGVDTVNLAVTGVPSGATALLSTNFFTSNGTFAVTLTLTNDATVAGGNYDMAVAASGAASFRLPIPVQVAYVWSGVNFTNAVSTNFASAGNWKGGAVPGASDIAVFNDGGGQAAISPTNIIISGNTEVASVRFGPEGGSTRFHNMEIQNGATFRVTGPGLSFSLLRDSKLVAQQISTTISGGGTLLVSNATANIGVLLEGQQNTTLDLRNLNNFVADVVRIGLGDYRMYPNYYTNGYVGATGAGIANPPTRFVPLVFLAKTNVIKASWVDPNNYNDGGIRDYALTIGNDEAAGTTANTRFTLGLSNALFLDSICWSQSGKGGGGNSFNFNAAGSYALFRGIGGGRMSVWAQGDASGTALSGSNVRGTIVDFSNGQVDALVDRLYLSRSRTNSSGFTIQGTLTLGGASPGSIFDVNTAFLGNQDVLNLNTGAVASVVGSPVGTLNVNSNATLKVNGVLHLGYTTAAAVGSPNYPENCSGLLNINSNGTVMASNILVGGATKLSVQNNITMTTGGNLIVTNGIGASDSKLRALAMTASTLTLHVSDTNPKVYVKTLTLSGLANALGLASVSGVGAYPASVPLISYETVAGSFSTLTLPSGLYGFLYDSGTNTINAYISTNPPNKLVWRGNVSPNWNLTDLNWLIQGTATATNFNVGDIVTFDDATVTGSTDINVAEPILIGQLPGFAGMVVSNSVKNYRFSGGTISGSSPLLKQLGGSLTMDALCSMPVSLTGGSLLGSGALGATTAQFGTVLSFSGAINGGLTASNTSASILSGGSLTGALTLLAGSLTNNGTISGTVSLSTNTVLGNGNTMNVTVPWSVPTNSTLINNGTIVHSGSVGGNNGLTINGGTLYGVGKITQTGTQLPSDVRVTMGPGGRLFIGNNANEIANMTIAVRLDFNAGSVSTFDVNNTTLVNDKLVLTDGFILGKVNFGAGNNLGGTLAINKIAGPDFNVASTLFLFDLTSNNPDNANPARPGVTPAPAPGLVWDISRMLTNLTLAVTGPPTLTNTVSATNIVFNWPEAYRGWRLEAQTNSLSVGISTNWATIANSFLTNQVSVPIVITNPTVFYRLAFP